MFSCKNGTYGALIVLLNNYVVGIKLGIFFLARQFLLFHYLSWQELGYSLSQADRASAAHTIRRRHLRDLEIYRGSLKVTGNGTIKQIIHDLLLGEFLD